MPAGSPTPPVTSLFSRRYPAAEAHTDTSIGRRHRSGGAMTAGGLLTYSESAREAYRSPDGNCRRRKTRRTDDDTGPGDACPLVFPNLAAGQFVFV